MEARTEADDKQVQYNGDDFHDFMVLFRQLHDLVSVSEEHIDLMKHHAQVCQAIDDVRDVHKNYKAKLEELEAVRSKYAKERDNIKRKYQTMSTDNTVMLQNAKRDFDLIKKNRCTLTEKDEIMSKYIRKEFKWGD